LKKIAKSIVVIITIFFLLTPKVFAEDVDFKSQIKKEDGSLFEKIIAECIGGIAETILNFTTSDELGVGFKNYDELIFNSNNENDSLSPFTEELWNKAMQWYKIFSGVSGTLILIAVIILSYKMMFAGMNIAMKNEAKESMMRLMFRRICNCTSTIIY
jgi:prophage DNA circulation protein